MSVPKKRKSKSAKKKGKSFLYPNKNHAKLLLHNLKTVQSKSLVEEKKQVVFSEDGKQATKAS